MKNLLILAFVCGFINYSSASEVAQVELMNQIDKIISESRSGATKTCIEETGNKVVRNINQVGEGSFNDVVRNLNDLRAIYEDDNYKKVIVLFKSLEQCYIRQCTTSENLYIKSLISKSRKKLQTKYSINVDTENEENSLSDFSQLRNNVVRKAIFNEIFRTRKASIGNNISFSFSLDELNDSSAQIIYDLNINNSGNLNKMSIEKNDRLHGYPRTLSVRVKTFDKILPDNFDMISNSKGCRDHFKKYGINQIDISEQMAQFNLSSLEINETKSIEQVAVVGDEINKSGVVRKTANKERITRASKH